MIESYANDRLEIEGPVVAVTSIKDRIYVFTPTKTYVLRELGRWERVKLWWRQKFKPEAGEQW